MTSLQRRAGEWVKGLFAARPVPYVIPSRTSRPAPRAHTEWPRWLSSGLTPTILDGILRQADQGYLRDFYQLVGEIAGRDALVSGLLAVRLSALSQRPVACEPNKADPSPARAEAVATFCQSVLDGLRLARCEGSRVVYYGGLSSVVERLCLAAWYGVAVPWVHWDTTPSGIAQPCALEFLDERRLVWDLPTDQLLLQTYEAPGRGVPVSSFDPALLLCLRFNRISTQVSMAGCARACLLSWWLRSTSIKDFASYLESWAQPSLVATTDKDAPGGYSADQRTILQNLMEDFMGDTRAILPPGFGVEVIQAVLGGEKAFQSVDGMTERHLQFAIIGNVGTVAGDATTYASSTTAQQVRDDITDGDSRFVAEGLELLLSHAVAVRYGRGVPIAKVIFEAETSVESIKARAEAIRTAGYPLTSLLEKGIPVDIPKYCEQSAIPLRSDGTMDPRWLQNLREVTVIGAPPSGADPSQPTPSPVNGAPPPPLSRRRGLS